MPRVYFYFHHIVFLFIFYFYFLRNIKFLLSEVLYVNVAILYWSDDVLYKLEIDNKEACFT
jgi:hypothetical protein